MNEKINLYSHRYTKIVLISYYINHLKKINFSYLGLGLMAARKSVFTVDGNSLNVTSPCVQEAAKGTPYKFAQNIYHVT